MMLPQTEKQETERRLIAAGVVLTLIFFAVDLATPLGVASGVLYIAVVLLGLRMPGRRYILVAAVAGTILTVLGFYLSPPGGELWKVLLNRFLALFAIWSATILGLYYKRSEGEVRKKNLYEQLLKEAAVAANESSHVEPAVQVCLERVCQTIGWQVGHLYRVGENSRKLLSTAIWYLEDAERFKVFKEVTESMDLDSGAGLPGRVLSSGQPAWIADVNQDSNFPRARLAHDLGVKAGIGFPVRTGERIVAVLEFFSDRALDPDPGLLEVMDSIGTQLGRVVEREESRRALQEAHDHLELRVEERTAELTLVNEDLRDFAYVVSHDLKAPLRGISSLSKWLHDDYAAVLDDEGRNLLDLLHSRTKRMDTLIEEILNYSRLGRTQISLEPVDSGKIIREVIDFLVPPQHIKMRTEGPLPEVIYYPVHLKQIFINLLNNAIIHLGKPQGEVVVTCRDSGKFWEFCVKDNGMGIDKVHFERIFKLFQSLKHHDTSNTTGIGLALVRKIMQIHGGSVWVESELDKGSAFYFTVSKTPAKHN